MANTKTKKKFSTKNITILVSILIVLLFIILMITNQPKPEFNSENAFNYLVEQVKFGPRNPGSEGHKNTKDHLIKILEKFSDRVIQQNFVYHDVRDSLIKYNGTNIISSFNLDSNEGRIMLAAHWDTRPFADQEQDSTKHSTPILGANDGASGVAVLLEVARILEENPIDIGVDIILFDLEDIGDSPATYKIGSGNPYSIGSEYFVNNIGNYRPIYGILLDMVGDKNLTIPKEGNSYYAAPQIVEKIWNAAEKVNSSAFSNRIGEGVMDDHIHFLKRGIKVVDLIHSPFPSYWHTLEDTPDKCSAESLKQVGDVIIQLLYEE